MNHILRVTTPEQCDAIAYRLKAGVLQDVQYKVLIEHWRDNRTLEQNAQYWALLSQISREAPPHMDGRQYAPDIWHHYFRTKFLPMLPGPDGTGVPTSTRRLDIEQMSAYITQIEAYYAENFA